MKYICHWCGREGDWRRYTVRTMRGYSRYYCSDTKACRKRRADKAREQATA